MELFNTPLSSPVFLIIILLYFIASSIETYDIRIIQAYKAGEDVKLLPKWVGFVYWICWLLFLLIVLLNWKYAIIIYLVRFILKVLPVLENIGALIMIFFRK